jgi:hypothetical protein
MAIAPENRGGANGGPQYDPANVNGQGGDGQSGRNYTGFAYSKNKEINDQMKGAKMAKTSTPSGTSAGNPMDAIKGLLSGLTPLDADPADPTVPVSNGVNVGRGAGEDALPAAYRADRREIENIDLIKKYLPDMINATRVEGAPDSYKQLVNYLKGRVI